MKILPGMLVVGMKPYKNDSGELQTNHTSLNSIFVVINLENLFQQNPQLYKTPKTKIGYTPVIPALLSGTPMWEGKLLNPNVPFYEIPTHKLAVLNLLESKMQHFIPFLHIPDTFDTSILSEIEQMSENSDAILYNEQHKNTEFDTEIAKN